MAKQTIGIGSADNDGTGDPLRTAFDKANDNFDELYAQVSDTAYASSWDGDTATAPSKNAVYDKFEGYQHPGYIAANWYMPQRFAALSAGVALTSNTIYYTPFLIERRVTISDLGLNINTASAGNNIKLAIYANNAATGRPTGAPLAETGNMSTTSTGIVTADITGANVTLDPGIYWVAMWADNSVVVVRVINRDSSASHFPALIGTATTGNIGLSTGRPVIHLTSAETYGTWPDAAGETFTEVGQSQLSVAFMMKAA